MINVKQLLAITTTITLFFCQNALAETGMDSIGTGSSGSYSHGAPKGEGSRSKKTMPHHISGNKGHHKSEGSASKSYSHHNKSEGSKSGHHASSYKGYRKGHGGHSSKCPFTHLLNFKDKLGLTDAQVAEIKKLRFEYQKSSIRNEAEHKVAHMEFDRLIHAEKVEAEAILSAAGKIAESKMEKIMNMAKAKIALLNLLTDEQRKMAHKMHSAHSSH